MDESGWRGEVGHQRVSGSKPWTTIFGNCPLQSSLSSRSFFGDQLFQRGNSLGCVDRDACGDCHRRDRQKHPQWRHRHSVVAAKGRGVAVNAAGLFPASLVRPVFFFLKLPAGDPAAMASRVQKIMLQPIVRQRPSPFVWLHGPCLYRGGCLGQRCPVRCVARVGSDVLFSFIRPVILTVPVRCLPFCPVLCFVLHVAALFPVSLSTGTFSLDRSDPPLPPLPHARARTEPHLSFSADAAAGGGVAVRSDGYADARLHCRL